MGISNSRITDSWIRDTCFGLNRDEDYNATPLNGKAIKYDVVELALSKEEAEDIYNIFTSERPHPIYRNI